MKTTTKTLTGFYQWLIFDDEFEYLWSKALVANFFEDYNITILKDCDYWNDTNKDGDYYCDLANEWADSMVEIYDHEVRKNAFKYRYFTQEVFSGFWVSNDISITELLRMWEYLFYSRLAEYALHQLKEYVSKE